MSEPEDIVDEEACDEYPWWDEPICEHCSVTYECEEECFNCGHTCANHYMNDECFKEGCACKLFLNCT